MCEERTECNCNSYGNPKIQEELHRQDLHGGIRRRNSSLPLKLGREPQKWVALLSFRVNRRRIEGDHAPEASVLSIDSQHSPKHTDWARTHISQERYPKYVKNHYPWTGKIKQLMDEIHRSRDEQ